MDLPRPTILTHAIWIEALFGEKLIRLFCHGLDIIDVDGDSVMHVSGLTEKDFNEGKRISNCSILFPCAYVTRISPGPEIDVEPGEIERRMNMLSVSANPPSNGLSLPAIRTILSELREANPEHPAS